MRISIEGLRKDKVLKALYDASHVQGLGVMQSVLSFSLEDAKEIIDNMKKNNIDLYFDYLYGRVLKVDITNDEFDDYLFDRDCGEGAAKKAIDNLKSQYEELHCVIGSDLEEVINKLKESDKLSFVNFNGHPIYSDNLEDIDDLYKRVCGSTKEQQIEKTKMNLEKYKKHKEEHNSKIKDFTKEYIEKAKGVILEEKTDLWAKIVPKRLADLYEGMELQSTLDIIIALGENKNDFESARDTLNSQGHSELSYILVLDMLKTFAPNGEEFVDWLKENN